ncbi:MAG: exodeoxyribonuclease VII large subunit [Clostridia bacterium]|nr:exodeoxyribonuclease VII large subunit [Clostridia bacterium]
MNDVISVTQLTNYIRELISQDRSLSNIMVKGEISNFKHHYSGHMYFVLKDSKCKIRCVMFKSFNSKLKFIPDDGDNVIISGSVSVYERDGQYQLYAHDIQPDGIGALYKAYEQLKQKLEAEGLFDDRLKKKIPMLPSRIAVITSATGAALRDIINVATRRFPQVDILIIPVSVQGEKAAFEVANAIERANALEGIDVIIVARGGGSIEELWAFNEEIVARCVFNSTIPVISAVGHETDYTIIDFVSDLRAPTPSAAAELAVPNHYDLKTKLNSYYIRLVNSMNNIINIKKEKIKEVKNPQTYINNIRQYLDGLYKQLKYSIIMTYKAKGQKKDLLISKLNILNPLDIINRGYCVVEKKHNKKIIKSIDELMVNEEILLRIKDGTAECTVKTIMEEKP